MPSEIPAHDRIAHILLDFIHCKAATIPDEIVRLEAALRVLPEIAITDREGKVTDPEALHLLWRLRSRVKELQDALVPPRVPPTTG